ncbi:hypothetical protein VNO77_04713 [Canavalia gladiata]|uniref:Glycosyltransferase n=1 Tax=Canavalia gladiata TaxID=3824 RepID=A0AAN9MXS7_CANGL
MGSEYHTLHIFFVPFLAHGHMIPTIDMAKLFAERGVKATIITTPLNEPFISKVIGKAKTSGKGIHVQTIEFPCVQAGLPQGCENVDSIPSPDLFLAFIKGCRLLQEPLELLMFEQRPDCVVADIFFPWVNDSAAKFGIPRLVFHGTGFFPLCAIECTRLYKPYKNVSSDSEPFVIPNLPGEIKMTRMQLSHHIMNNERTDFTGFMREAKESELRSYGVVVNSFYELEKVYADHFRKELGRKAWHIGPVSICNRDTEQKAHRGKEASIDEYECLKWLDAKQPNSVVYVCFGTMTNFSDSQLKYIAMGLEASGQLFIWVVMRKSKKEGEEGEEWLPEGFEKRIENRGLIIRGWAPQVLILEHEAVGAFVTHCGWNSTLEAVTAGVPMVTWPVAAEQFYNEKLVTEVLKIGVPVGVKKWVRIEGDSITWDMVEKAVKRIMAGDDVDEMGNKVKVLSQLARHAVEERGSSYLDLNALIKELRSQRH